MKINIENFIRQLDISDGDRDLLNQLIVHLKMLRDKEVTLEGFFDCYKFIEIKPSSTSYQAHPPIRILPDDKPADIQLEKLEKSKEDKRCI